MTLVVREVRPANVKLPASTMSWFVCDVGPCQSVLRAEGEDGDVPLGWTALLDPKTDKIRHGCNAEHTKAVRDLLVGKKGRKKK